MNSERPEFYEGMEHDFDLELEKKLAVYTAVWFLEQGLKKEKVLETLNLTEEEFEKWIHEIYSK